MTAAAPPPRNRPSRDLRGRVGAAGHGPGGAGGNVGGIWPGGGKVGGIWPGGGNVGGIWPAGGKSGGVAWLAVCVSSCCGHGGVSAGSATDGGSWDLTW